MTKLILPWLIGALFFGVAHSQNVNYPQVPHPEWFKTVPYIDASTPDWAVMMYGPDPNFYEVLQAYEAYYRTREYKKTEHGQNFKYWVKQVQRFVNDEGFIRLPSPAEEEKQLADLRKRQAKKSEKIAGNWTSIGPFETYISGTTTPYSNQVNVYSLDQSNSHPDILYCGSESGAMYKSTNRGVTWTQLSFDEPFSGGYGALEIHPTNPNIVMIGVNNRIYRTTDGGMVWAEVKNLGGTGYEIKYRPSNPDSIFCVASNGLYLSTNGGATWGSAIYTQACHDLDWHPTDPNVVYLLKSNTSLQRSELFRSDDGGSTWTLKDNGYYMPAVPTNASIGGGKIAVSAADPDRVYVCLIGNAKANDNGWIGVLRSNNKGDSWTVPAGQYGGPYSMDANGDYTLNVMPWNVAAYSDGYHQGFYNFDFEVSPLNANLMWIGTIRLSESSDGGTSFLSIGAANSTRLNNVHADIQDIEVNGNEVWVANDGGIEHSTDNLQSFTSRKYGISGSNYWGFGAGWNEDILVGGRYHVGNSGYYQTYGIGNSVKLGGVEESTGYVHPTDRKAYFNQSWSGGTAVRSIPTAMAIEYTDYGILPKIPNEAYTESNSSGIYFDPRYSDWMYMGEGSSIWRSKDKGTTFQSLRDFGASGRTLEIEISRSNPNYIYVVFKPNGTNARQIWRTTDGGVNWAQLPSVPATNRNKLEITLNPSNENDLWVCSNDAANGQKVYRLITNGTAWQNMSTSALDGQHPYDIFYQGGTNNVVYLATLTTVMQYDVATSNWIDYGDGLPLVPNPLQMKPFYRDNKLRLATGGHGIWESPLATTSTPIAQPITTTDSIFCSRDTVRFDSYSIASGTASYTWSFSPAPQWVSSLTVRNPKVVFGNCTTDCNYDVTLTVTDGANQSTKTITDMVKVNNQCQPDTLPIKSLRTVANGDYFISQEANLTNLTHFTVTGWWKPNGTQEGYAALFSSGDWCAHCDYTEGLVFDYYASKLWYKWPGNAADWGSNSGIDIPLNQWSYVALVITPTSATLYLNDKKHVDTRALTPGEIQSIYIGYGHYSKSFKGDIDEVTMWKRALSDEEVRRLRHITKEDVIPTDPNLIGYWQFNKFVNGTKIMDHAGKYHGGVVGGSTLANSTAPIGGGNAQLLNLAGSQFVYDFSQVGTKIWMSDCELPSGTIVATRLNIPPDAQPNANDFPDNYWILNQYATSLGFPPLDSIEVTTNDAGFAAGLGGSAGKAIVHLRSENGEGGTWNTKSKGIRFNSTNSLRFNRKSNIQGGTQITLSNGPTYITEVDPGRICEADTIPSKALSLPGGSGNYAVLPALNLNSNTVTMSAWIKPNGLQNDNAGVIFCRGGTTTAGIHMKTNNEVRYHWDGGQWGWSSGAIAPANEWSHVALVVEPTRATLYLNGVPFVNTSSHAVEAFDNTMRIGNDPNSSSRTYKGDIDEVCIWKRALTQSEIRELMHLTKEDVVNLTGQEMKVYLQFNEDNGKAYDKTGNRNHATLNSTSVTRTTSSAPVGGGVSNRTTVNSGGVYTFGSTGLKMGFNPTAGNTYPNGEVLVSRLNVPPDQNPNSGGNIVSGKTYWVVRNFGINQAFTVLDSIVFDNLSGIYLPDEATPSQFSLFKRRSDAFGDTWGMAQDPSADLVKYVGATGGKITFSTGNGNTSFSQFVIADGRGVKVSPKVFLQGAFSSGQMTDVLREGSLLPLSEPYTGLNFTHKNGGGLETTPGGTLAQTGVNAITDWLMVELRDKNNPANVLYTRSALLQRDGDVVDMDGTSPVNFLHAAADNYYLAVRHRNHLGVRTPVSLALTSTATSHDFTTSLVQAWDNPSNNSNDAMTPLGASFGLWRGNASSTDHLLNAFDMLQTKIGITPNQSNAYHKADLNMDGLLNAFDMLQCKFGITPNKSAHLE